jgi:hypothetical protein
MRFYPQGIKRQETVEAKKKYISEQKVNQKYLLKELY